MHKQFQICTAMLNKKNSGLVKQLSNYDLNEVKMFQRNNVENKSESFLVVKIPWETLVAAF